MLLSSLNIKMGCVSLIGVWREGVALWVPEAILEKLRPMTKDKLKGQDYQVLYLSQKSKV